MEHLTPHPHKYSIFIKQIYTPSIFFSLLFMHILRWKAATGASSSPGEWEAEASEDDLSFLR